MWGVRVFSLSALVIVCSPAFAYIDPGSGSAIVSLIIGFFVAMGLVAKTYWYKLKALFKRPPRTAPGFVREPAPSDED